MSSFRLLLLLLLSAHPPPLPRCLCAEIKPKRDDCWMELTAPPDLLAEKDLDWERCEAVCYRALDQAHNDLRSHVAKGNQHGSDGGTYWPAMGMCQLRWNDGLAREAQRWADQCIYSQERRVNYPQLLLRQVGSHLEYIPDTFHKAIFNQGEKQGKQLLGTEEIRFNTTMLRSFGLFTQVAWWSLREVGCGAMVYWPRTMTQSVMHLVCNYDRHQVVGELLYRHRRGQAVNCTRPCPRSDDDGDRLCDAANDGLGGDGTTQGTEGSGAAAQTRMALMRVWMTASRSLLLLTMLWAWWLWWNELLDF